MKFLTIPLMLVSLNVLAVCDIDTPENLANCKRTDAKFRDRNKNKTRLQLDNEQQVLERLKAAAPLFNCATAQPGFTEDLCKVLKGAL